MKRKFAILGALAALIALAVPASSMAGMYPPNAKFEITTTAYAPFEGVHAPEISTSLGSCQVTKITGQAPATASPTTTISIPTPTLGTCSSGTSLTLSGEWKLYQSNTTVWASGEATMRFASLPGCKLSATPSTFGLFGVWSNGSTYGSGMQSGYHADSASRLSWSNDGGSCALAGQQETVSWQSVTGTGGARGPVTNAVVDLSYPGTAITVSK
jgi:hypothetical protein